MDASLRVVMIKRNNTKELSKENKNYNFILGRNF